MTGILETMQAELAEAKAAVVTLTETAIRAAQRAEAAEARAETAKAASIAVLERVERLERVGSMIAELWATAAHSTVVVDGPVQMPEPAAPTPDPDPEPIAEPEPSAPEIPNEFANPPDAYEADPVVTRKPKAIDVYPENALDWFSLDGLAVAGDTLLAPGKARTGCTVRFRDAQQCLISKQEFCGAAIVPEGAAFARWSIPGAEPSLSASKEPGQFSVEEDMKILLAAKSNLPIDEIALKLERPDDEIAERLDILCPKPRNAAKLSKAMIDLRRRNVAGKAA